MDKTARNRRLLLLVVVVVVVSHEGKAVASGCFRVHVEELYDFDVSPDATRMITWGINCVGHMARMGETIKFSARKT
jgi:hypothetical protein